MYEGFFDGASRGNPGEIGMGCAFYKNGKYMSHDSFGFMEDMGTNNEAEYKALIALLEKALVMNISSIDIYGDSKLVIEQINGNWKVKNERLSDLFITAIELIEKFDDISFLHIPRSKNSKADLLANKALDNKIRLIDKNKTQQKFKSTTINLDEFNDFDLNLTILIEECAEVIQAATRLRRFGKESRNPNVEESLTNIQLLQKEIGHVFAMVDCLKNCDFGLSEKAIVRHRNLKLKKLTAFYWTKK